MAVQDGNCEEIQLVVPSIHGVIEEICEPEILSLRSAGSAFDDCQRFELLIWTGTYRTRTKVPAKQHVS
eukprot:1018388-Pleurochrysis_carterae.AAC.1